MGRHYSIQQLLDNPEPLAKLVRAKFPRIDWGKTWLQSLELNDILDEQKRRIANDQQAQEFLISEIPGGLPGLVNKLSRSLQEQYAGGWGGMSYAWELYRLSLNEIVNRALWEFLETWKTPWEKRLREDFAKFLIDHPGIPPMLLHFDVLDRNLAEEAEVLLRSVPLQDMVMELSRNANRHDVN